MCVLLHTHAVLPCQVWGGGTGHVQRLPLRQQGVHLLTPRSQDVGSEGGMELHLITIKLC